VKLLNYALMYLKCLKLCTSGSLFAGMNTGVQDAHNLAWKLCLLQNGVASPSILQTYESERRPVRLSSHSQAFYNPILICRKIHE
jgi:hypothetical protein